MPLTEITKAKLEAMLKNEALIKATARNIFKSFDTDADGNLDRNELEKIYEKFATDLGITPPPKEEIDDVYNHMDHDKDGVISLDEFVVLFRIASQHYLEGKMFTQVPK